MSCSSNCAGASAPKWPLRFIDDRLKAAAADGCSTSVLAALARTAGGLVHAAGFAAPKLQSLTPVDVARVSDGVQRGLLLAALQFRDALSLSPQGRQALADFCGQPVAKDAEGPRG